VISQKLKSLKKSQAGFTLIEIIAAVAITGIISLGASISTGQVLNQTSRNNDYTTASRNTLNALHWISHDVSMAQTINGAEGFPLTEDLALSWIGWDNTEYSANYTLDNGILRRVYSEGGQVNTTFIAEYINSDAALTSCISDNGTLTVTITCSVGEGDKIINVTKVREIASRPNT
jgi:prepilin-type N-terminal cleavage/methylation domain-containing protein